MAKAEQMIDLAIRTIRGGGTLKNEPISLYKSRYDDIGLSGTDHWPCAAGMPGCSLG